MNIAPGKDVLSFLALESALRATNTALASPAEEVADFSFRSVIRHRLNFSYFPKDGGKYTTNCINVTVSPLIGAIILSFYANAAYPQAWSHITDCGKCAFIRGHDVRHRAILHKRENSWDPHFHVSVQPEYCDAFVPQALEITALSPHDETHLKLAARYLCKNPFEPGLAFRDGSYAENGGARSMYDPQVNLHHINGPLRLV